MKTVKLFLALLTIAFILPVQAQSVDEILQNYFENTGGMDAWKSLEGVK